MGAMRAPADPCNKVQAMHQGLAVSEDRRFAGYDAMLALWAFAARRLGLR
jgi:hypothetical protein